MHSIRIGVCLGYNLAMTRTKNEVKSFLKRKCFRIRRCPSDEPGSSHPHRNDVNYTRNYSNLKERWKKTQKRYSYRWFFTIFRRTECHNSSSRKVIFYIIHRHHPPNHPLFNSTANFITNPFVRVIAIVIVVTRREDGRMGYSSSVSQLQHFFLLDVGPGGRAAALIKTEKYKNEIKKNTPTFVQIIFWQTKWIFAMISDRK